MDRLNKLSFEELPEEETDKHMEELISAKLDRDLRAAWTSKLEQEYGVRREADAPSRKLGIRRWSRWAIGLAAAIALLLATVFLLRPPEQDARQLAQTFLDSEEIFYPGTVKGGGEDIVRDQAYQAFNQGAYNEAAADFAEIAQPDPEDHYYHGLSLLLDRQPGEAVRAFRQVGPDPGPLAEELAWYLSLALILNGQDTEAANRLSRMAPEDWKYDESQQLLKGLP